MSENQKSATCPKCQSENLRYFHSAGFNRVGCNSCQHIWAKGIHNDLTTRTVSSVVPYAEDDTTTVIYERRSAPGDSKILSQDLDGFRRAHKNHRIDK